ncbi:hypothetical protein BUALT_Bualt14G0081700 [Buddleja alternifolia]|uniref:F-box/LRR-repeat protein 15/At3g58940/PEG3-like LRR domain-containing protein n=1 Tax=Buddleja alternifolia TaxID=168488 RepID=A0AAV6WHM9_9LAMI|nr:hypothetical protein BUALT_Bualt14G0081700 [Buddleja alternifolia]
MENCKRMAAIDEHLHLPEPIIQHIQSFLSRKEAASTAVICKSWYNSWLTRPILDFDEHDFPDLFNKDEFYNFVKRSMERYHELNLNKESFKLWMNVRDIDSSSLATESIVKAVKLGVNNLNIEIYPPRTTYILPKEVFEIESLKVLSVFGCKIDWPLDRKLLCSKLQSLILRYVLVGDDVIWDIISSCPLIEKLLLYECQYSVRANPATEILTLRSPIKVSSFHKLKYLFLQKVNVNEQFFSDFSLKFPCLEDLSLHDCHGYKGRRQISSHSLKCISLTQTKMLWVNFDVPNIRKFTFKGTCIPRLSFTSALKEWESDISIVYYDNHLNASWFHELKRFLTNLTLSKISLCLWSFRKQHIDHVREIEGLPRPVLEKLMLPMHLETSMFSSFLDGLFWSCRPKVITINGFCKSRLLEFLCKRLIQVNENCYIPNQNVFGQCGLEEVNVESFEVTLNEWLSLPWQAFLDSLKVKEYKELRFLLKWMDC